MLLMLVEEHWYGLCTSFLTITISHPFALHHCQFYCPPENNNNPCNNTSSLHCFPFLSLGSSSPSSCSSSLYVFILSSFCALLFSILPKIYMFGCFVFLRLEFIFLWHLPILPLFPICVHFPISFKHILETPLISFILHQAQLLST